MNRLKKTAAALGALIVLSILANGQHNQTAIIERISDTDISRIEQQSSSESDSRTINVYNDETGKLQTMQLEDYIYHVVAGEMPARYDIEALKAQAVAARTYALCKLSRGRPDAHPDADLCDDYRHCAAYRSPAVSVFGTDELSAIRAAVRDTEGEILTSEGAPIAAVFHCVSGPRTESAADVWGEDVPYLQSVVSPGGTAFDGYESAVTVSADDFREKAGSAFPAADLSGPPSAWFKASVRSDAGGIKTVKLGGVTVEGTAVRELFGLRSTNFTVTTSDDSLTFHTIGYGHGVGLSQYGAKYMAENGADYREILAHYYPSTELVSLNEKAAA